MAIVRSKASELWRFTSRGGIPQGLSDREPGKLIVRGLRPVTDSGKLKLKLR